MKLRRRMICLAGRREYMEGQRMPLHLRELMTSARQGKGEDNPLFFNHSFIGWQKKVWRLGKHA